MQMKIKHASEVFRALGRMDRIAVEIQKKDTYENDNFRGRSCGHRVGARLLAGASGSANARA